MSKQVTTIPAKNNQSDKKLKVAAYCRVSTEHEEQKQSLKSQVAYYTQKICDNPDWDFAGIYAEQEAGTRVDNREEVQRLMEDCRNGKVDLILMKSLSCFGRNTLDVLLMLDELSKLNVVAYFETEDIYSNDPRVKKYINMAAAEYAGC
ncbi:MAG: recombinase family protein [Clostridiales bacterium]